MRKSEIQAELTMVEAQLAKVQKTNAELLTKIWDAMALPVNAYTNIGLEKYREITNRLDDPDAIFYEIRFIRKNDAQIEYTGATVNVGEAIFYWLEFGIVLPT